MNVQFDQRLWKKGSFAENSQRTSLQVLKYQVYFVIFDYGVFVFDYILMVEALQYIDLLFNALIVLLANGYFLHCNQYSVVEVDSFIDFAICAFTDLFYQLVALDGFAFIRSTHFSLNIFHYNPNHQHQNYLSYCS